MEILDFKAFTEGLKVKTINESGGAMEYIVRENVLTDNILMVAPKGKIFKGGYVAILKEYTYQNPWSDKETVKRFRSSNALYQYLDKHYTEEETGHLDFTDTCLEN